MTRAIDIGERHLDVLRRLHLDRSEEAIWLVVTVAAAYFERGDVAHANRMCRRAIEQAEETRQPGGQGLGVLERQHVGVHAGQRRGGGAAGGRGLHLMESADEDRGLAPLR